METEKIKKQIDKYKYPLLALLLGLVILVQGIAAQFMKLKLIQNTD